MIYILTKRFNPEDYYLEDIIVKASTKIENILKWTEEHISNHDIKYCDYYLIIINEEGDKTSHSLSPRIDKYLENLSPCNLSTGIYEQEYKHLVKVLGEWSTKISKCIEEEEKRRKEENIRNEAIREYQEYLRLKEKFENKE